MGPIAERLVRGVFAAAKQDLLAALLGPVFDRQYSGSAVRSIAMRLGLAAPTGTPKVSFSAFKFLVVRLVAGNDGQLGI